MRREDARNGGPHTSVKDGRRWSDARTLRGRAELGWPQALRTSRGGCAGLRPSPQLRHEEQADEEGKEQVEYNLSLRL